MKKIYSLEISTFVEYDLKSEKLEVRHTVIVVTL